MNDDLLLGPTNDTNTHRGQTLPDHSHRREVENVHSGPPSCYQRILDDSLHFSSTIDTSSPNRLIVTRTNNATSPTSRPRRHDAYCGDPITEPSLARPISGEAEQTLDLSNPEATLYQGRQPADERQGHHRSWSPSRKHAISYIQRSTKTVGHITWHPTRQQRGRRRQGIDPNSHLHNRHKHCTCKDGKLRKKTTATLPAPGSRMTWRKSLRRQTKDEEPTPQLLRWVRRLPQIQQTGALDHHSITVNEWSTFC